MKGSAAFWVKFAWTVFLVCVTWAAMVAIVALHWDTSDAVAIFLLGLFMIWGGEISRQFLVIVAAMVAVLAIIAGTVIGVCYGLYHSAQFTAHLLHWN